MPDFGKQPFEQIRYCIRCCMPETSEGITFDEMGICSGCRSSEQKMHINWAERKNKLREILEYHKSKSGDNYDCLVPISGGKDSAFQLHVLVRIYGMKVLAVTFSHTFFSETGKYNLQNILDKLDVDHIMFTPNKALVRKLIKKSLFKIGDPCWHCHAGIGAFPLQVAMRFKIPLVIWGESAAELGSKATYEKPIVFDEKYFLKVSSKVDIDQMIDDEITTKDLYPFKLPSSNEYKKASILGIHLGDYIFWDGERQVEFLKKEYDWREDDVEGTYKKYKNVECVMVGVHDHLKFLKRGFGRGTDHATADIRAGLLTREEGFELAKEYDQKKPKFLDDYLKMTGLTEEEFIKVAKSLRTGVAKDLP